MNKFTGIGRITRDIDLRKTQNGTSCANFSLAIQRRGGEETDFVPCVAWGKTAETLNQYVRKGQRIAITGRIQTRSYERNDQKIYVTEVVVEEFDFIEKKANDETAKSEPQRSADNSQRSDVNGYVDYGEDEDLPF